MYQTIRYEKKDGIGIATINRPEALNALNSTVVSELEQVISEVEKDAELGAFIITGEGRSFCAGFNLNDLALDPPEDMGRIQRDFYIMQRMCSDQIINMRRCEQPIIGALKGFAVGGGLSISCACDMRVLGESYKMNAGYLSIGYTGTDMGGSFFLPKIVRLCPRLRRSS